MKKIAIILTLILLTLTTSCSQRDAQKHISIERFELEINNYPNLNAQQQSTFINNYTTILTILNQSIQSDSINHLPLIIPTTPIYQSFITDVTTTFSDTQALSHTLHTLFSRYTHATATHTTPQIKTYITPYNQSIIISDSTQILLALNHYLGSQHPSYSHLSENIRINKTPQRIPYDITEALIRTHYISPEPTTLLDHILYEGFVIHAQQQLIPHFQLATSLGYTPQQLQWSNANSQQIWQKLITADLLYTTNQFEIDKLIQPTPYTASISPDSPGKLGIYIGTQIITSYINAENISDITELYNKLKTTDSQTILMQSQYYGR